VHPVEKQPPQTCRKHFVFYSLFHQHQKNAIATPKCRPIFLKEMIIRDNKVLENQRKRIKVSISQAETLSLQPNKCFHWESIYLAAALFNTVLKTQCTSRNMTEVLEYSKNRQPARLTEVNDDLAIAQRQSLENGKVGFMTG